MTYSGIASAPADTRQAEIASLFVRWNAALAAGNPSEAMKLYAQDAVLEPTVSNTVRTTPEEIRNYFPNFLKAKPQAVVNYRQIHVLDDNTALDTGVYTFDLTKEGKHQKMQARYTYVYENSTANGRSSITILRPCLRRRTDPFTEVRATPV